MMAARSHSILFVLITIFIDAIGFGIIMPVLPRLIMDVGEIDLSRAIAIGGSMALVYALASFVCAPILGNLSDAYGRRPVLLIALGGLAVDYLLMALAQTLPLLFIGRLLTGAFGGSYGPAQAAIADITLPEQRAKMFGYVSAAFGVGFVVGPAFGGLLGEIGERAPFYAASALAVLNFAYGLFAFPETLQPERRRRYDWRRANPLGAWRAMRAIPGMTGVASVLLLWQIASLVYPITWSYYAIAQFGWSNALIGVSLATVGVVIALSQIFLTGPLVKKYGERTAATFGLIGGTAGFIAYALASETWMAFAAMVAIALQGLVQPSLMAMLSRRAAPETQGEVQGISSMALGLGAVIAPFLLTPAMAYFTSEAAPFRFAGAAFVVAAVMSVIAMILLQRLPQTKLK